MLALGESAICAAGFPSLFLPPIAGASSPSSRAAARRRKRCLAGAGRAIGLGRRARHGRRPEPLPMARLANPRQLRASITLGASVQERGNGWSALWAELEDPELLGTRPPEEVDYIRRMQRIHAEKLPIIDLRQFHRLPMQIAPVLHPLVGKEIAAADMTPN